MSEFERILWVAATPMELRCAPQGGRWSKLATGCGPAAAGAVLGLELGKSELPDLVVGIGVAGAYPDSGVQVGSVVRVDRESFADLGCEDGDRFVDLCDLEIAGAGVERWYELANPGFFADLPSVSGATCSVCTGSSATAATRALRTGAAIESMEGAAWALTSRAAGVPFAQVRAISNIAGPRERAVWRLSDAVATLERTLEGTCRKI